MNTMIQEVFNFTRGEVAVVCVLLLRGPQTPGELRGRTERMYKFDELSDVQTVLQKLGLAGAFAGEGIAAPAGNEGSTVCAFAVGRCGGLSTVSQARSLCEFWFRVLVVRLSWTPEMQERV